MRDERGSATIYAAVVITALVAVAFAAITVGGLIRLGNEADRAADLAALSGARAALIGEDGCTRAEEVAEHNGARVLECDQTGPIVTIDVGMESGRHFGRTWTFESRARAAPTDLVE